MLPAKLKNGKPAVTWKGSSYRVPVPQIPLQAPEVRVPPPPVQSNPHIQMVLRPAAFKVPDKKNNPGLQPALKIKQAPLHGRNPQKRRKAKTSGYKSYIYRVLKNVHPGTRISKNTISSLDSFCHDMFERIATEAGRLVKKENRSTLRTEDIQAAVKLVLPGELKKHACVEGTRAVASFSGLKISA